MSATSRSNASARLRSWVRWFCAAITSTPSLVRRLPASRIRRIATSFASDGERRTSKRSCTAVESLLTFCPPGPEERTKLSSISRSSMEMSGVMRIAIFVMAGVVPAIPLRWARKVRPSSGSPGQARRRRLTTGQIPLRQHLAFFHRRLVECIDPGEMRGDHRLQHEVHHQRAKACLIKPREPNGAHRAAVLRQGLGGGAALRGDEIADRTAAKFWLARALRELRIDARALPFGRDCHHREQLVARAGDEQLQLRMLVDRPERAERRRAL